MLQRVQTDNGCNFLAKGKGKRVGKGGGGKTGGFNKGGGMGNGGKGKGGQGGEFQGTCHWCGKWGQTASQCTDKDAYMKKVRSGNCPANCSLETTKETSNLQNEHEEGCRTAGGSLSSLDKASRFVNVCSLHTNYRKSSAKLQNQFDTLKGTQDEDLAMDKDSLKRQGKSVRWTKKLDINHVAYFSEKEVELSTARRYLSGAHCRLQRGRKRHVRAHRDVHGGQTKTMNMQVTDVSKALMSVARICDAGHIVVSRPEGGVTRSNKTGDETKLSRENNVYTMHVTFCEEGSARQG